MALYKALNYYKGFIVKQKLVKESKILEKVIKKM
jgi:hypothetical protein